jgi:uncharacterized damage-inducible protein DinB
VPITELLLPEFDDEMSNTKRLLERVPESAFAYKPHEKSMTLGRLASHVAELPFWAKRAIDLDVLEMQPGRKPYIAKSRDELLQTFEKNVREARQAIVSATDDHLKKPWTFKFKDRVVFTKPRYLALRSMMMNHLIHHRGQLGVFLRLNDIEIPGMYGPSADENAIFESAPDKHGKEVEARRG